MGQLADRVRRRFPGQYDDLSDADLESKVLARYPQYQDLATLAPKAAAATEPAGSWAGTVADWLPTIAGTAGGMLGAAGGTAFGMGFGGVPGAIGGATLGGAAGKAGQTLLRSLAGLQRVQAPTVSQAMLQSAGDIGTEAVASGAAEALGAGAGKLLGAAGGAIYRKALRPSISERLAGRAAQTAQTGLAEGINPFAQRSLAQVEPRIAQLTNEAEQIIASPRTTATGAQYSPLIRPQDVTARVTRTPAKFAAPGAAPEDREAVASVTRNFLRDASKLTQVPTSHQIATGIVDQFGNPITRTITKLKPVSVVAPMSGPELLAARRAAGASAGAKSFGVTRGAETEGRKELYHAAGQTLGETFPESAPLMARTSRLIDLKRAAFDAQERYKNSQIASLRHLIAIGAGGSAASEIFGDEHRYAPALRRALVAEAILSPRLQARAALLAAGKSVKHPLLSTLRSSGLAAVPRSLWGLYQSSE